MVGGHFKPLRETVAGATGNSSVGSAVAVSDGPTHHLNHTIIAQLAHFRQIFSDEMHTSSASSLHTTSHLTIRTVLLHSLSTPTSHTRKSPVVSGVYRLLIVNSSRLFIIILCNSCVGKHPITVKVTRRFSGQLHEIWNEISSPVGLMGPFDLLRDLVK